MGDSLPAIDLGTGRTALVILVAAGRRHSVALKSDCTLWAWESSGDFQLGSGNSTNRLIPTLVVFPRRFKPLPCPAGGAAWLRQQGGHAILRSGPVGDGGDDLDDAGIGLGAEVELLSRRLYQYRMFSGGGLDGRR